MKLHLGVIDVPEPYDSKTTGAVGEELEKNYKLFSSFYEYRKKEITNLIAEDAAIGIERLLKGEDVTIGNTFAVSGEEITDEMHKFVTSKDAEIYGKAAPPLTIPTGSPRGQRGTEGRALVSALRDGRVRGPLLHARIPHHGVRHPESPFTRNRIGHPESSSSYHGVGHSECPFPSHGVGHSEGLVPRGRVRQSEDPLPRHGVGHSECPVRSS